MIVLNRKGKSPDRVIFTPDGRFLLLATAGRPVELWGVDAGSNPVRVLPGNLTPHGTVMTISPFDGSLLILVIDTVIAFDPVAFTERWRLQPQPEVWIVGLDADSHGLYMSFRSNMLGIDGYQHWKWVKARPPARRWSAPGRSAGHAVAAIPPARKVAFSDSPYKYHHSRVHLFTSAGKPAGVLNLGSKRPNSLVASPDGSWLAAWCSRSILVWGVSRFTEPPTELKSGKGFAFTGVAFHPSGRFLAATSNDATVKLFDTSNWSLATTYTWDIGRMRSVAFSPDGLLAAAGSDTGKVVVWDVDV